MPNVCYYEAAKQDKNTTDKPVLVDPQPHLDACKRQDDVRTVIFVSNDDEFSVIWAEDYTDRVGTSGQKTNIHVLGKPFDYGTVVIANTDVPVEKFKIGIRNTDPADFELKLVGPPEAGWNKSINGRWIIQPPKVDPDWPFLNSFLFVLESAAIAAAGLLLGAVASLVLTKLRQLAHIPGGMLPNLFARMDIVSLLLGLLVGTTAAIAIGATWLLS